MAIEELQGHRSYRVGTPDKWYYPRTLSRAIALAEALREVDTLARAYKLVNGTYVEIEETKK